MRNLVKPGYNPLVCTSSLHIQHIRSTTGQPGSSRQPISFVRGRHHVRRIWSARLSKLPVGSVCFGCFANLASVCQHLKYQERSSGGLSLWDCCVYALRWYTWGGRSEAYTQTLTKAVALVIVC
ncbi:hypothetical protein LSAT2_009308 [Lamellibrachia satsuma]|nr:hypothetical protein LSAT2_009308 [Lamellibrachia satsuma]